MTIASAAASVGKAPGAGAGIRRFVRRNPTMAAGGLILALVAAVALAAPLFAGDPITMQPAQRLLAPSPAHWLGTDHLGRDVFARTLYGARISLLVGLSVATLSIAFGLVIGLLAGYFRPVEAVVMRMMDGLMAIPAILLAIALVALTRASVSVVIAAITIPEIPRVVRLVRAVVLSVREAPYVEAAVAGGSRAHKILIRHILPNTIAPLIVQATYITASAILTESALSFLGAGVPPEVPTWGTMIASGQQYADDAFWVVGFPGLAIEGNSV